jgi:protein associated with RNAse G/E
VTTNLQVGLVPSADLPDDQRGWLGTFHGPGGKLGVAVYVDIATPPRWDGGVVRTVDLDLDVIRMRNGWVVVDDEDEFAEHQVVLGYPPEVIALAEASRDRVHAAILDEDPPYDGSHRRWLRALDALTGGT